MINEYETQSELNPKLWADDHFNEKLRLQLLKIARAFYKFLGVDVEVKDVTLTGSNANYNWTKHSDIDLHLIINYKDINDNDVLVRELMQAKKSLWNNTYPIKFKGMNIELYAQDANEPHTSTGVYSLLRNDWIKKPESDIISVEDDAIDKKAEPYEYEIDHLDPYEDNLLDKIKKLKARLKQLRQTGLEREGEYSVENLAFKSLRNSGHLEKLSDLEKDITLIQLTPSIDEQDFKGPFGKEHDYSDYGGPYGTGHRHKTDFKKGPGKHPMDSISSDRDEEEKEDDDITGYTSVKEIVIGQKIHCNNCTWNWNIVDGGDDLYMCHKCGHDNTPKLREDPKKGTGKKPKGSGRRLYTDENPSDTVSVKFKTKQDVSDTLNKASFKSKSHKRQSQIINLIHQRLRVAVERTKDPEKKKRLRSAYNYIKKKKEASKAKTKRLAKENFADGKRKGKSRPGRVKRSGASCKGSISSLRRKAKKYGGERGKMYHWCANMKSGKKKK